MSISSAWILQILQSLRKGKNANKRHTKKKDKKEETRRKQRQKDPPKQHEILKVIENEILSTKGDSQNRNKDKRIPKKREKKGDKEKQQEKTSIIFSDCVFLFGFFR
jgi:hypothetical protein